MLLHINQSDILFDMLVHGRLNKKANKRRQHEEYLEFTKSHKQIKNASTCETIVKENELKTGIRILTQSKMQGRCHETK